MMLGQGLRWLQITVEFVSDEVKHLHKSPDFSIKKVRALVPDFFKSVAGAGVEPTSGDYEPPEIPFLHPAP